MTHLKEIFSQMELELNDLQEEQFNKYTDLLIDYNKKVNLTSILEPSQINLKHYLDSVLPVHTGCFKDGMKVIDVGCGAGFPSVPLKIYMPSLKFTLLDSLNKRINFLNILTDELDFSEILHITAAVSPRVMPCRGRKLPSGRDNLLRTQRRTASRKGILSRLYCVPHFCRKRRAEDHAGRQRRRRRRRICRKHRKFGCSRLQVF